MKRILLVDDDFLALNAFYALLDWQAYGLEISYEAHDSRDAMTYLKDHPVDIAFLDVCMPDTDGVSLLRQIRTQWPRTVCVMLSSYSDYPYVRESLKAGAVDYILKYELTGDSVLNLLRQNHIELSVRPVPDADQDLLPRCLEEDDDRPLPGGCVILGMQKLGRPLLEAQQNSIIQTSRHLFNAFGRMSVWMPKPGEVILYLPGRDAGDKALPSAISRLNSALKKYFDVTFRSSSPMNVRRSSDIRKYYRCFIDQAETEDQAVSRKDVTDLTQAICGHHESAVEQLLEKIWEQAPPESWTLVRDQLADVCYHLSKTLYSQSFPPELPVEKDACQAYLLNQFKSLCGQHAQPGQRCDATRKALAYLHASYGTSVRLPDVAAACGISANHLSTVFKRETGMSIVVFLNSIRIYHAAYSILYTASPITSIAEEVGFRAYNHFFRVFRETVGMTPSEFKHWSDATAWLSKEKERLF